MTIEQWGVLALVILLPVLASVARLRRAATSRDSRELDAVEARVLVPGRSVPIPKQDPPPLPEPHPNPPVSLARPVQRHRTVSEPPEAQGPDQKSAHDRRDADRVRAMRNLRRAIVVTTILSPPTSVTSPRE